MDSQPAKKKLAPAGGMLNLQSRGRSTIKANHPTCTHSDWLMSISQIPLLMLTSEAAPVLHPLETRPTPVGLELPRLMMIWVEEVVEKFISVSHLFWPSYMCLPKPRLIWTDFMISRYPTEERKEDLDHSPRTRQDVRSQEDPQGLQKGE